MLKDHVKRFFLFEENPIDWQNSIALTPNPSPVLREGL
jgi:hypothetical protein